MSARVKTGGLCDCRCHDPNGWACHDDQVAQLETEQRGTLELVKELRGSLKQTVDAEFKLRALVRDVMMDNGWDQETETRARALGVNLDRDPK